jgi:DNA-binding winged helix-turn-helix (wHTH) protein
MSIKEESRAYVFGPFVVDVLEGLLLREGQPVQLTPKAFETLLALIENSGHCIGKDVLMRRVWPDSYVEENNLSQNISQLRRALQAEGKDASTYIETVPRRGYRFRAPVTVREGAVVIHEKTRTHVVVEEDDEQSTHGGRVDVIGSAVAPKASEDDAAKDEFPPA